MRTRLQLTLFVIVIIVLGSASCVRYQCVLEDQEEEASAGVKGKSFRFASFDQNQDHVITFEEFRERMLVKFGLLDTDRNGKIDLGKECHDTPWCAPALTRGLATLSPGIFLDDASLQFNAADQDGDKKLDRKEYAKLPLAKDETLPFRLW